MSELAMFPQNKPVEIEARNPRCSMRSAKIGYVHTINLEVDEETLALLKTLPKEAELKLVMWINDHGDSAMQTPVIEEKPKKEAKPKGEYGKAWQVLWAKGLFNMSPIRKWLFSLKSSEQETDKQALYKFFDVPSCSFVSMDKLNEAISRRVIFEDDVQTITFTQIMDKAREAQNNG